MDYLHAYKGKEPQKGFSFMPKRVVDVMACEVMRGVRLTGKTLEYVAFKVPRKTGTFAADLFPDCKSGLPGSTFDEYWGGENKDPLRQEMKPQLTTTEHASTRKATFMAKVAAGGKDVEEFKGH